MALAMRSSATAVQAQTANVVSRSRGATLRLTVTDAVSSQGYLAIGSTAADPPATYADVTNDLGSFLAGGSIDSVTAEFDEGSGLFKLTIRHALPVNGWAVGTKLWACLFDNVSTNPGPTDAPDIVSSGFDVVA